MKNPTKIDYIAIDQINEALREVAVNTRHLFMDAVEYGDWCQLHHELETKATPDFMRSAAENEALNKGVRTLAMEEIKNYLLAGAGAQPGVWGVDNPS